MKKKITFILIILVGGIALMNIKDKSNKITFLEELVESVEFYTAFDNDNYDYAFTISKKHSDSIGILEWIDEV